MPSIGDYFVKFSAEGFADLSKAFADTGAGLRGLNEATGRLSDAFTFLAQKVADTCTQYERLKKLVDGGVGGGAGANTNKAADEVKRLGFNGAGGALTTIEGEARRVPPTVGALGDAFSRLGAGLERFASSTRLATIGLYGWVTAGVMASTSGQILGVQFQELSRQIASIFAPQVRWLIGAMQDAITWFQRLSGAQQAQLRWWGLLAGGALAAATALPFVVGAVKGLVAGFGVLQTSIVAVRTAWLITSAAFLTNPIGLAVAGVGIAVAAVVAATTDWRDVMGALVSMGPMLSGPFEAILQIVKAIAAQMREWANIKPATGEDTWENWLKQTRQRARLMTGDIETPDDQRSGFKKGVDKLQASTTGMLQSAFFGLFNNDKKELAFAEKMGAFGQQNRDELTPRLGGIEDVEHTYRRIAEASLKVGGGAEKNPVVDKLDDLWKTVQRIESVTDRFRLPTTR